MISIPQCNIMKFTKGIITTNEIRSKLLLQYQLRLHVNSKYLRRIFSATTYWTNSGIKQNIIKT